jgi:hypothetical protein
MEKTYGSRTESVCPVCLKRVEAARVSEGDDVFLVKECPDHGPFKTVIWRGAPPMAEWRRPKAPVHPEVCYGTVEKGCPFDCGLCADHVQLPCSVLLEVTDRCDLRCAFCFADAGRSGAGAGPDDGADPSLASITRRLERAMAAVGRTNLQLSGGEPTLRDDLPKIVGIARQVGYSFIQVNTNGLRLAHDTEYAKRLRDAGLSSVFLQFDGVDDAVYRALRGRALLDEKLRAIDNCGEAGLGVILVPTLVANVNAGAVGEIVRKALRLAPVVRGIHFQPVSFFGRFPKRNGDDGRFTLPELMRALEEQTGGLMKTADFSPPGCEHERCSFHATYMVQAGKTLRPIGEGGAGGCCTMDAGPGGVGRTIETVSRRWALPQAGPLLGHPPLSGRKPCCGGQVVDAVRVEGVLNLDAFLREVAAGSFTISAMAFQDAYNLDLERLRGCCISVIDPNGRLIPFCAYNCTSRDGHGLYRRRSG